MRLRAAALILSCAIVSSIRWLRPGAQPPQSDHDGGGRNPHEGCAALVLNRYRQRRARVTRRQAGVLAAATSIALEMTTARCPAAARPAIVLPTARFHRASAAETRQRQNLWLRAARPVLGSHWDQADNRVRCAGCRVLRVRSTGQGLPEGPSERAELKRSCATGSEALLRCAVAGSESPRGRAAPSAAMRATQPISSVRTGSASGRPAPSTRPRSPSAARCDRRSTAAGLATAR